MPPPIEPLEWLRYAAGLYSFDVGGVFRRHGNHNWPIQASDPAELEAALAMGGHLLPLPKEPAALANVLEVSIVDHLVEVGSTKPGLEIRRGTERGYPDIELAGPGLDSEPHAVDVKVARRKPRGSQARTQSRITLYTGNTYFKWPQLHWPGTFRPFADYSSHLDIVVLYTLNEGAAHRVDDLEIIVQPAWTIASRKRSSTTREYIGAVDLIEDLRSGTSEFESPDEFYSFWRAFPFKISAQVQRQFNRLVEAQAAEIAQLRAAQLKAT